MTPQQPTMTVALKHAALSIQTGPFGSQLHAGDYSPGGRPVVNPAHLRDGRIEPDLDCAIDQETFDGLAQHELLPGDIVMGRRGELGRCGVVSPEQTGWVCGTGSIRVRPDTRKLESRWLRWLLSWPGTRDWLSLESVGTTMENLGAEVVGAMPIPLPALSTQRAIVDYLDRETARLDALVAAKERVLGLLAEKRRALITRAVTKGIDPRVPFRDSGIPWLGEIPAHWRLERAKFLFQQSALPVREDDEMVTCFRDGQVTLRRNRREEGFTNANFELGYQGIRAGQLILHSMDAFAGAIGVSDSDGKCSSEYIICDPQNTETDNYYYGHLLRTMALAGFVQASCPAVRERAPRIRFPDFGEMFLPVPPLSEQGSIVARIGQEIVRLDNLRSANQRTVALLKERRAALIAAAVTGQIDVGSAGYYTDDAAGHTELPRRQ